MSPEKNRAVWKGKNDAINSGAADRLSVAAVRALRTKIKVNITAGNTPNDDITQWSCESCCQTLFFFTADTPICAFIVFLKRMH
jgi:hypothetical protein